ncbi:MAG: nitroreductase family protein [Spirochaetota bacterium]
MDNARQIIASRLSCRTYSGQPLSREHETLIDSLLNPRRMHSFAPLGSSVRAVRVENTPVLNGELSERCSYGSVTGAPVILVPIVERSRHAMEDLGAAIQSILLYLEAEGIAACWFAGNFSDSNIARQAGAGENEVIPAVVTMGYRAHRRTASEGPARFSVGSRKRRRWEELFFELEFWDEEQRPHGPATPLTPAQAPDYEDMLEAVRLAPSTSNNQPWRVYRYSCDSEPDTIHMFLRRNPGVDKVIRDVDVQKIDVGVAMAHFREVAEELRMPGFWVYDRPTYLPAGVEYIASWQER